MPVTTSPDQVDAPRVVQAPKFPEFVALMASLMALTALSIDIMLPALPLIRDSFGVVDPNAQQLVITLYMVGFGVGQLFYGALSDRFGRKVVLGAGLAVYAAAAALCLVAAYFSVRMIEDSSVIGVRAELDREAMTWAEVDANGLQLFMAGTAPTEADEMQRLADEVARRTEAVQQTNPPPPPTVTPAVVAVRTCR